MSSTQHSDDGTANSPKRATKSRSGGAVTGAAEGEAAAPPSRPTRRKRAATKDAVEVGYLDTAELYVVLNCDLVTTALEKAAKKAEDGGFIEDGEVFIPAILLRKALQKAAVATAREHGEDPSDGVIVRLSAKAEETFRFSMDDVRDAAKKEKKVLRRQAQEQEEMISTIASLVAARLSAQDGNPGTSGLLHLPGLPSPLDMVPPLGTVPTHPKKLNRWLEAYQSTLEIRRTGAHIRDADVEHRRLTTMAEIADLELVLARQAVKEMQAEAHRSLVYTFYSEVDEDSVAAAMDEIGQMSRTNPGAPIRIVLSSPGGSVIDGLALFDFLRELSSRGHEISTVALGQAASMGGVLLQAGDRRIMGRNAWMLMHEVHSGVIGTSTSIADDLEFTTRLQERLVDILAERSTLTAKQLNRKWKRRDWWVDANEALKLGLVDELI